MHIYFHSFYEIKKIVEKNNLKILKIDSFVGFFPFYMNFNYPESFERKIVRRKIRRFVPSAHTWDFTLKKIETISYLKKST